MPRLALYTFGTLTSPLSDPGRLTREFYAAGAVIYREMARHPGHIAHAEAAEADPGSLFDADWGDWGEFAVPAWYTGGRTARTTALAATLSLWTDLRSAADAVHTGAHRAALGRRYDWFERNAYPNHVFWWVTGGATPTWRDGVARLEHLHGHGDTPDAFTFHRPHDAAGPGAPPAA